MRADETRAKDLRARGQVVYELYNPVIAGPRWAVWLARKLGVFAALKQQEIDCGSAPPTVQENLFR